MQCINSVTIGLYRKRISIYKGTKLGKEWDCQLKRRHACAIINYTKASRGEMSYRVIATAYIVFSLYILVL
jgi:hypothetical protein